MKAQRVQVDQVEKGDRVMISHPYWQGAGVVEQVIDKGANVGLIISPEFPKKLQGIVTLVIPRDSRVSRFSEEEETN